MTITCIYHLKFMHLFDFKYCCKMQLANSEHQYYHANLCLSNLQSNNLTKTVKVKKEEVDEEVEGEL